MTTDLALNVEYISVDHLIPYWLLIRQMYRYD